MRKKAEAFDHWIRPFRRHQHRARRPLLCAAGSGRVSASAIAEGALRDEGYPHGRLWHEGNTGDGFETAFGVLGNVGLYLGALRRHELTNPAREERSPFPKRHRLRYTSAPLRDGPALRHGASGDSQHGGGGISQEFHSIADEFLFIDENTRGIWLSAGGRRAERIPVRRLQSVGRCAVRCGSGRSRGARSQCKLFSKLDVDRFFYSVRPYYKPYRIGRQEYRGANAGDFSGINEIDLLLGPVSRQRPVLRTAPGGQDVIHAAAGPGALARVHDVQKSAGRVAGRGRSACERGLVSAQRTLIYRSV